MKDPIRVLVVDDHFVVRKGVCVLLADAAGVVVAGEAADGREAVEAARRLEPEVILMDLRLPGLDGVAAIQAILAERPQVGIVALTATDVEDEVLAAVRAGAQGYLAKTSPREDFLAAIRCVARGEAWLPPRLTARLLSHLQPAAKAEATEALTEREREIVALLARGWSNRRIAQELHIADITVRTHVSRILGKLGVSNRVEAALHAVRSGLASLDGTGIRGGGSATNV
jgi:DNA-binding NarL/FixJ family response regulator